MPVFIVSDKSTPYQKIVGDFLEHLQDGKIPVKAIGMVALYDKNENRYHNSSAYWNATGYDTGTMAGVMQMDATQRILNEDSDEDGGNEDDDPAD